MRVGVMGAGAVGCLIGGQLAAAETQVTLIGREGLCQTIAKTGLHLSSVDGSENHVGEEALSARVDVSSLSACDVVLLCVKSTGTRDAAELMGPHLSEECLVVSFQNGVSNPRLIQDGFNRISAPERPDASIAAGIVHFNVIGKGNGAFAQTTDGALSIGRPASMTGTQSKNFGRLVEQLRAGGFTVKTESNIVAEQYAKLVVNLNNAVISIAGRPTLEVLQDAGYRKIVAAIVDEALDVLKAANIRPARFRGVPLRVMPKVFRLPSPLLRLLLKPMLKVSPDARPSMWSDLERGRPTEVDDLNGEIVRLSIAHGHPAPLNTALVQLVHQAERSDVTSPCLSPTAFKRALESG